VYATKMVTLTVYQSGVVSSIVL